MHCNSVNTCTTVSVLYFAQCDHCGTAMITNLIVSFFLFLVTPLDVVKIRLQAQKNPFPKGIILTVMTYIGLVLYFIWSHSTVNVRWPDMCFQYLGKCFVYCNGLMDHICVCENGNSKAWYKAPGHFNGTIVRHILWQLCPNQAKQGTCLQIHVL